MLTSIAAELESPAPEWQLLEKFASNPGDRKATVVQDFCHPQWVIRPTVVWS